jgi:hypothetical protein
MITGTVLQFANVHDNVYDADPNPSLFCETDPPRVL